MLLTVTNRRKTPRRRHHHPAWITFEDDLRGYDCYVMDISEGGAKLALANVHPSIGSTLYLSTVPHAVARQRCVVVWKKRRLIGVQFI
jgi:PilZ domain-containing protein